MKKKNNMKELFLPWSKSISNRCLILWALAEGKSRLRWILQSDDTVAMIRALRALGVQVDDEWKGDISIMWWIDRVRSNTSIILDGNESGTSVRFLTALWVLFVDKVDEILITGSERMCERPIVDLVEGLKQIWVNIESSDWCPPVKIQKFNTQFNSSKIKMNGEVSSQYFTSLLQIAWMLPEGLEIEVEWDLVSKPYIDITIHELEKFGVKVINDNYKRFRVQKQKYNTVDLFIEWDASALSYIASYIFLHGWELEIKNLGSETKQWDYSFLNILKQFWFEYYSDGKSTQLKGKWMNSGGFHKYLNLDLDFSQIPDVSLTFMVLAIFFPGNTKLRGLQTLNLKECKRIDAMATEIRKLWVEVESDSKSMIIGSLGDERWDQNIDIQTYNDHRIAMSFWILQSYIWGLNILDKSCVNKTYPNFWRDLDNLSKK